MNVEVGGYNYGRIAWDLEDDGFTISDKQNKIFTFYVSGRLEDYDTDATDENFFEIENDDLGQLRLVDINRLRAVVVACIEDIGIQFKKLNSSMKEIKDELGKIGGLTP